MRVFLIYTQVREVGLPGPLDPAPIPVGVGPEQAPGTAPLTTILNVALVTAPPLKRVGREFAVVSIAISQLISLAKAYRSTLGFCSSCLHICHIDIIFFSTYTL